MVEETRVCERCGVEIPAARVKALPDTVLCIECSSEIGGEYKLIVVPENTGKAGSLKKNYGSWTFKRVRRRIEPKVE